MGLCKITIMKKKKQKVSVAEKVMRIIDKRPKAAEDIKKELKDRFGFNERPEDIRVNLLYLLRREKIKRKKESDVYKYYI